MCNNYTKFVDTGWFTEITIENKRIYWHEVSCSCYM